MFAAAVSIPFDPLTWFLVVWWTIVGAMIGSFANVVVWRMPRGESLSSRGSHCPKCGHAIRVYDNIPVFGYFFLRGRCRDCGEPISARYPTVEALFAGLFFLLALVEGAGRLRNLPRPVSGWVGLDEWAALTLHATLLSTLLCALLMERDGAKVPRRLFGVSIVLAGAVPLWLPHVRPVPACPWTTTLTPPIAALVDGISGGLVGAGIAILSRRLARKVVAGSWPFAGLAIGMTFGWQLGGWLTAAILVIWSVANWQHLVRPFRLYGVAFWLTLFAVLAWGTLAADFPVVFLGARLESLVGMIVVSAVASILLSRYHRPLPTSFRFEEFSRVNSRPTPSREALLHSPTYRLPELDTDFLQRPELRPVRMQLELLKPELILTEQKIHSTIVVFGGTQIVEQAEAERRLEKARAQLAHDPDDRGLQRAVLRAERILAKAHFYDEAREFARIVSTVCQCNGQCDFVVVTGGGPGIMEAANRGAYEAGSKSIGLNITLPQEQLPNPYISPELCFQFHYFAMRKMHFLMRAKALVVFPGGFGTLDELFDALTLRQTRRMQDIPIILYGSSYWREIVDFQRLADEGVIADSHLDLIQFTDSPQATWEAIARYHAVDPMTGTAGTSS